MTSGDEWEESLSNIDELISCSLGTLETEDVIYLEEYLVGEDFASHSSNVWSALKESNEEDASGTPKTRQKKEEEEKEGAHTNQPQEHNDNSENVDDPQALPETASGSDSPDTSLGPRQLRATRGVSKPKFVSYQAFPSSKEKRFVCELCGQRLSTRESRRRHIIAKHIKERNNVCNDCGKKFVFKFSLKAHAAIHSAMPSFTCVCGQTFSVRGSYMNHVRRVHRAVSEVKYSCELCFKSFVDHHTLRLHLISVHKPKTIACLHNGCNKVFSTSALMKSHYWYHLKQRFPCDECGQSFSTESYMYKHRRTHSGIRPYMCVDCGKTYLSVSHLNKHRRVAHSTYRPFQCSFCGKCYKTKDQLMFHESSHRGEKPFQCEVCGYATAYRNTYYAHRKKHQTQPSTNTPQKKDKGDVLHGTQHAAGGSKANTVGKNRDKNEASKEESSSSKCKSSHGVVSNKTLSMKNIVSSDKLLDTAPGSVKGDNCSMSVSSSTASVNVICIVPSEPNNTSIFPEGDRSITSFPLHVDNHCNNIQSPTSDSLISSEPLNLVQPVDSEVSCATSHQNTKPESYELVADLNITEEKKNPEQTCIVLSNTAKCSLPMCESGDESLLLLKVDDDSYVALFAHHSMANLAVDAGKESTSCDKAVTSLNINTNVLNLSESENTESAVNIEASTDISEGITCQGSPGQGKPSSFIPVVNTEASNGISKTCQICRSSAEGKPSSFMHLPISVPLEICTTSTPAAQVHQHVDSVKPSAEVSLSEHLLELDSGIANLSGPIVDESFSLAQMEVHCPLCEEQFLCMDDYVTHLESCHN